LNRASHDALRKKVFQQALLATQPERLHLKRNKIWLNILETSKISKMVYGNFKEKIEANLEMIASVDEVI
jgi:hypothetical protein